MFNNLVKVSLKFRFFENKEEVIAEYLATENGKNFKRYEYTQGKVVIIDTTSDRAYSRNGFFFSVIAKDAEYITSLNEVEYLTNLNKYLAEPELEAEKLEGEE